MRIRRATRDDLDGFIAVVVAVADERRWIGTEAPVDTDVLATRLRTLLADGNDALFVLEDGACIVGTMDVSRTRVAGVASLGMCIVAEVRGTGHGRALLDTAIAHARAERMHKLELEVWPDNERAIALYASCGFETEGIRRDHYRRRDGTLRSSQVMALLLSD
jgi:RimJ/RimL family protein N-acetyltransferase